MNFKTYVCAHSRALLERIHNRAVAVRLNDSEHVTDAAEDVALSRNELVSVIVESPLPMESIGFQKDWGKIPVTLICPSLGRFRNLARRFDLLRELNVKIFLPWCKENLLGLQILASLGISCGIAIADDEPDWDSLADLMTYALLERVPHAPIEPLPTSASTTSRLSTPTREQYTSMTRYSSYTWMAWDARQCLIRS